MKVIYQEFSNDGKNWVRLFEERDGTLFDLTSGFYDPDMFKHRRTTIIEYGPEPLVTEDKK
jgi:starvation-inducible outer membrane lipoprotein